MIKIHKEVINQVAFYALVAALPLNLGYHFMLKQAYVRGLLIDYLLPTLYIQDILAVILVLSNLDILKKNLGKIDKYLVWFLFAVFLSVLSSVHLVSSAAAYGRLALYILVMLCIKYKYKQADILGTVVNIFSLLVVLLSLLAFLQWYGQGSVFDNYLFFGEQPYSVATPGINIESFLGEAKVPAYGTFRHPNVFGGILSILLIWLLFSAKERGLSKMALVLGTIALVFTLSFFAWTSFLLGLIFYFMFRSKNRFKYHTVLVITGLAVLLAVLLPYIPRVGEFAEKPSYYRRANLLYNSYRVVSTRPLFGVGYGVSSAYMDKFYPPAKDARFAQPPHNIFVLLLAESGCFALLFFTLFIFKSLKSAVRNPMLFISLAQAVFLGMFDHYFFTIHQTQLLFWVILGFL